ncbi:MAG: hypothetical protein RMJ44_07950 [Cytophagales bacterium]|nr:hypothetical protein [Bernardetiaceae bacterium]MDW8211005.1 hypothetical protein [Cytophagales bacterium]
MFKKIFAWLPSVYAIAVIVLVLAPLCWIARYNHASADDYEVSRLLLHTRSIWQTTAVLMQRSGHWTGCFLQALFQPVYLEGIGFQLVPIGIILTLLIIFYLGWSFLLCWTINFRQGALLSLSSFAVFFRLIETPEQIIFWSMCAISYIGGYVCTILFLITLVNYLHRQNFLNYAILIITTLLAAGSSAIASLLVVILCTGVWIYALYHRKWQIFLPLFLLTLLSLTALVLIINSPGTLNRMAEYGSQSWLERSWQQPAIFALNMYRHYLAKWLGDSLFMLSSLAVVIWLVEKRPAIAFSSPVVWLISFVMLAGSYLYFFIPQLAVGYIAGRHKDMALLLFLTGGSILLFQAACWLKQQFADSIPAKWLPPLLLAGMLLTLTFPEYISNLRFLWEDIRSRTAAKYDAQIRRLYQAARLYAGKPDTLAVEALQARPFMLYVQDSELEADPSNWKNRAFASYFGIAAVRLVQKQEKE